MSLKKKNTYKATEVNERGGLQHGANIHAVTVRINYYVWDMIKILNQHQLYGFHFEAKIGVKKTIVILTHKEKEILDEGRKLLKSFHNEEGVLFLLKVEKTKKSNLRAFMKLFLLMGLGSGFIYGAVYFLKDNVSFSDILKNEASKKESSSDEIITQKVEIDIEKLKGLQEIFKEESYVKDMKKMMNITTEIISSTVSDEEKAKYSSEELVKNFKGKSGIEFVLKESNSTTFKKDVKELNEYAMGFVKDNNFSMALDSYKTALNTKGIKEDDKALTLSNQANLYKLLNNDESAKAFYGEAKNIYAKLAKKDFNKFSVPLAWTWSELVELEENVKKRESSLQEIEKIYKKRVKRFRKMAKRNPKKYSSKLAWSLNLLANFYSQKMQREESSLQYREEAKSLYQKMFKKSRYSIALDYFKTINSLGEVYLKQELFVKAEESYTEALLVVQKMLKKEKKKYEPYVALSFNNLAILYTEKRKYKKAEVLYADALSIYDHLVKLDSKKYKELALNIHMNLGRHYAQKGKFLLAKERYQFVLAEYNKMDSELSISYKLQQSIALNALAKVFLLQGEKKAFFQARKYLSKSLAISEDILFEQIDDARETRAKSYFYLATSFYAIGQNKQAENYYLKSIKLVNNFEIEQGYVSFLTSTKQYLKARRLYDSMLLTHKEELRQAQIWMEYGEFYFSVSDKGARDRLNKALVLYNKISKKRTVPCREIEKIEKLLEKEGLDVT